MDNHAADRLRLCVYLCPESSLSSYALALDTFRMMQFVAGAPQVELCRVSQDGRAVAHPDGQMAVDGGLAACRT